MFASLYNLLRPRKHRRSHKPLTRSHRAHLSVEALEGREVPTVAFLPKFGGETVATGSSFNNMQNPTVNLIFSGNDWNTSQGFSDLLSCTSEVQSILNGPYLSGLTQYGSDGKANLGFAMFEPNTVPSGPTRDQVQTLITNFINKWSMPPGNNDWQHAPIYVVISDPTSANNSESGFNNSGTYTDSSGHSENFRLISMGTAKTSTGAIDRDGFTDLFSHELVETLTNGITINPGKTLPMSVRGDNQISDNEPDGRRYVYRLDGNLVQAYWSVRDQAYIVPDHNTQRFNLFPVWNTNNTFANKSQLVVMGDQKGTNFADVVSLDKDASTHGVTLTLNGEKVTFDQGRINAITVNTINGTDTVRVYAVPSEVTVVSLTSSHGKDSVTIGAAGSVSGISSSTLMSVDNLFGTTSLALDASNDGAQNIAIYPASVLYGSRVIDYFTRQQNGQTCGVTTVTLKSGAGSHINASAITAYTTFYLWWAAGDVLTGNAKNKVHVIYLHLPIISTVLASTTRAAVVQ